MSADVSARPLRAPRANRVFCTDEKHIRTENTVIVKNKDGAGVSYKPQQLGDIGGHDCKRVELLFFT